MDITASISASSDAPSSSAVDLVVGRIRRVLASLDTALADDAAVVAAVTDQAHSPGTR